MMKRQFVFLCKYGLFGLLMLSKDGTTSLDDPAELPPPFPVTAPSADMGWEYPVEVNESYSSPYKRAPSEIIEWSQDWPYPSTKKNGEPEEEIGPFTDYYEASASGPMLSGASGMLDEGDWDNPFKSRSEIEGQDGRSAFGFDDEIFSDMQSELSWENSDSESDSQAEELSTENSKSSRHITQEISGFIERNPDFLTIGEWKMRLLSKRVVTEKTFTHNFQSALWRFLDKKKMLKETEKWVDVINSPHIPEEVISFVEKNPEFLTIGMFRKKLLKHSLLTTEQSSDRKVRHALREFLKKRGLLQKTEKKIMGVNSKYITQEIMGFVDKNPEILCIGEWREKLLRHNLVTKEQLLVRSFNRALRVFLEGKEVLSETTKKGNFGKNSKYLTPQIISFVERNIEFLTIADWRKKLRENHIITEEQSSMPRFNSSLSFFLEAKGLLKPTEKRTVGTNSKYITPEIFDFLDKNPEILCIGEWGEKLLRHNLITEEQSLQSEFKSALRYFLDIKNLLLKPGDSQIIITKQMEEKILAEAGNMHPEFSGLSIEEWKHLLVEKAIVDKEGLTSDFNDALKKFLQKEKLLRKQVKLITEEIRKKILAEATQLPEGVSGLTIEGWRHLLVEKGIVEKEELTPGFNDVLRKFLGKEKLLLETEQVRLISEETREKILAEATQLPEGVSGLTIKEWKKRLLEKNIIDKRDLTRNFSRSLSCLLWPKGLLQETEKPQHINGEIISFVQKNRQMLTMDSWIQLLLDKNVIDEEGLTPEFEKVLKFFLKTKNLLVLSN